MKNITLHSVGLMSLFKLGVVLGLFLGLLPAILTINILAQIASSLATTAALLGSLQGDGGLGWFVTTFAGATFFRLLFLVIVFLILYALYNGVLFLVSGLVFNLLSRVIGGLQVTVTEGSLAAAAPAAVGAPSAMATPAGYAAMPPAPTAVGFPQQAQAGPRLEIIKPFVNSLPIRMPESVVGSGANCQVRLGGLPEAHFQIRQQGAQIILVDLTNGQTPIMVQGHTVQGQNLLKDGFVIQTMQYQMTFRGA